MSAFIYFAFIYLDVSTLRLLSYILFVLASADIRPPSTYIYRVQPKSKSDSPKKISASQKNEVQKAIRSLVFVLRNAPPFILSRCFP